jgi:predicted nucleic acid-binding protein
MLDASVLIDYFRKKNKEDTLFVATVRQYDSRLISVVAKLEVFYGCRPELVAHWQTVFAPMTVVPFTDDMVAQSHDIVLNLKRKSLLIDIEDIMIAATALVLEVPLATLNRKHFERIDGLTLLPF